MKNILDATVSLFNGKTDPRPTDTELPLLLTGERFKKRVLEVRNERDPKRQQLLKSKLPCFTVSGKFSSRKGESLIEPTGLVAVDIDAKDNTDVRNFDKLKEFMSQIPYVAYCGLSARGAGYFCIIPITRPDMHKEHYESLKVDFARCGLTIDATCNDIGRLRFVSYDPKPYMNPEARAYGYVLGPKRRKHLQNTNRRPSGETAKEVADIIETIVANGIDITGPYGQWFEIGCALASEFGEDGRDMFHAVSQFGNYDPTECDYKFDEALKVKGYSIASFFHYAKLCGVTGKAADLIAEAREAFKEYLK